MDSESALMAVNATKVSDFTKETSFHGLKYVFDGSAKLIRRSVQTMRNVQMPHAASHVYVARLTWKLSFPRVLSPFTPIKSSH